MGVDGRHTVRALFDHLICVAGGGVPGPEGILGAGSGLAGIPYGVTDVFEATRAGALAAHRLDRDDLHWETLTHPGGVVWPVVLALGASNRLPLNHVLTAAELGYEVTISVARLLAPIQASWHATTICGSIGAAAAGGFLLAGESGAVDAFNHAASVAGGTRRPLFERSQGRLFLRMHAAMTGLNAAFSAFQGLRAAEAAMEGAMGLFSMLGHTPESSDLDITRDHSLSELAFRTHAASGFFHAAVDAAMDLTPGKLGSIGEVVVEVGPAVAASTTIGVPNNPQDAWGSLPTAVAGAMVVRGQGLGAWPLDQRVVDLIGRVRVAAAPRPDDERLLARVVATSANGNRTEAERRVPHGHPTDPLTDEELAAKAVGLRSVANVDVATEAMALLMESSDRQTSELLDDLGELLGPGSVDD